MRCLTSLRLDVPRRHVAAHDLERSLSPADHAVLVEEEQHALADVNDGASSTVQVRPSTVPPGMRT